MRRFFSPPTTIASRKQPITMSSPRRFGSLTALPKWMPSQLPSTQNDQSARPPPSSRPKPGRLRLNACMAIAQLASEAISITP